MDPTELLRTALFDDPMFAFIQPDEVRRRKALEWYVPPFLRRLREGGRVDEVAGSAVALWVPPGSPLKPPLLPRSQVLTAPFRLGFTATQRMMEFAAAMDEAMREHRAHAWQLVYVAVDPSQQRRGLGASVLTEGLRQADAENRPCSFVVTADTWVPYFGELGFELEHHLRVEGLPQFWTLRRDPRPAGG
jgi:ribosomal protein S18 acetylase RimI-like enzyme